MSTIINKDLILKSISLSGSADESNALDRQVINIENLLHIVDYSSGNTRIRTSLVNKFNLILNQPLALESLSHFDIRCILCKKVITYPAWYYEVKYAVNHFHYFVCFDSGSSEKVNCSCKRG